MADVVIKLMVDVLAALHEGGLEGNVFGFDTARAAGSRGFNTSSLATAVRPGDQVLWEIIPLECEAGATISAIEIPGVAAGPRDEAPMGSRFWCGVVGEVNDDLPYSITIGLGRNGSELTLADSLSLVPATDRAVGTDTEGVQT